ncbi:MAG: sigma-70 family RNA polymerase sigma factor [Candidatus Kapabacteria bacterium]|nr:sigma-70 family RNA polymerase sigma factor [Candidatus Kapabacteria bacterium]
MARTSSFTLSEPDLVQMMQSGNEAALEYIYDNYSAALYGVLLRILKGDSGAAEDVLQDAYTKIWLNRASYDSAKATLFTWMLTIARNLGIDKLRSAEFRDRTMNQAADTTVGIDNINPVHPNYAESIDLRELVGSLPREQYMIIDLMYFQGYSQSEIAEDFGIPLGTVKSRARLALITLRDIYAHGAESGDMASGNTDILLAIITTLSASLGGVAYNTNDVFTTAATLN